MLEWTYMSFYRSFSSDDTKAWPLPRSRWSGPSIVKALLAATIVLALVLSSRS